MTKDLLEDTEEAAVDTADTVVPLVEEDMVADAVAEATAVDHLTAAGGLPTAAEDRVADSATRILGMVFQTLISQSRNWYPLRRIFTLSTPM